MTTTEEILNHHMACFRAGDLEGMLSDYTDESILDLPTTQIKGLDGLRRSFTYMLADFGMGQSTFEITRTSINGEFAYIFWHAQTEEYDYHVGTDTFVIRGGKIVYQTFGAHREARTKE